MNDLEFQRAKQLVRLAAKGIVSQKRIEEMISSMKEIRKALEQKDEKQLEHT